uniref:Uncharacterized protein n=1 Tax=Calidris pygmaea TaxID=425635 RepID=A0A8C3K842_9CHAR
SSYFPLKKRISFYKASPSPECGLLESLVMVAKIKDLRQTFEVETGYGETNAWAEWVKYTVNSLNQSNCYACASGRPTTKDSTGMWCMIALYQEKTTWGNETCHSLSLLFPALGSRDVKVPPGVNHLKKETKSLSLGKRVRRSLGVPFDERIYIDSI